MAVDRVVLIPRNGYVNRLQAFVSAQILAERLGAQFKVAWEPQTAAPDSVKAVLDLDHWQDHLIKAAGVLPKGLSLDSVPIGLNHVSDNALLLAGGMKGEQEFIPQLRRELVKDPSEIILVAGGKFWLDGSSVLSASQASEFRRQRFNKYSQMHLNSKIESQAQQFIADLPEEYVGLHLRYSDRNVQAPLGRTIERAVAQRRSEVGDTLFLCGDDENRLASWERSLANKGWNVRVNRSPQHLASSDRPATALVDWRILSSATQVVFFSESSFGEEAAVASGHFDESVGLAPSRVRAQVLRATTYLRNAVTYPSRHWW